jgi:hypothetical protein
MYERVMPIVTKVVTATKNMLQAQRRRSTGTIHSKSRRGRTGHCSEQVKRSSRVSRAVFSRATVMPHANKQGLAVIHTNLMFPPFYHAGGLSRGFLPPDRKSKIGTGLLYRTLRSCRCCYPETRDHCSALPYIIITFLP